MAAVMRWAVVWTIIGVVASCILLVVVYGCGLSVMCVVERGLSS